MNSPVLAFACELLLYSHSVHSICTLLLYSVIYCHRIYYVIHLSEYSMWSIPSGIL